MNLNRRWPHGQQDVQEHWEQHLSTSTHIADATNMLMDPVRCSRQTAYSGRLASEGVRKCQLELQRQRLGFFPRTTPRCGLAKTPRSRDAQLRNKHGVAGRPTQTHSKCQQKSIFFFQKVANQHRTNHQPLARCGTRVRILDTSVSTTDLTWPTSTHGRLYGATLFQHVAAKEYDGNVNWLDC